MNELSLFTGAGGGILASILLDWHTIGYVEYDEYCQKIIRQRIRDGIYDDAPVFGDIREFDGRRFAGCVDIITAGFPCQPFSVAGKRAGADDERNMWPETLRIIREVRPRFVLLENVPGLRSQRQEYFFLLVEKARQLLLGIFGKGDKDESNRAYIRHFRKIYGPAYLGRVLGGLAESGYDAEWITLGADDVGAPHQRKRLWILAHSSTSGLAQRGNDAERTEGWKPHSTHSESAELADPSIERERHLSGGRGNAAQPGEEHGGSELTVCREDVADTQINLRGTSGDEGAVASDGSGTRITWWDTDPADVPDAEGIGNGGRCDRGERRDEAGRVNPSDSETGKGRSVIGGLGRVANELADRSDLPRTDVTGYIPRVATGLRNRVSRLKAIGNGQVPMTAVAAWHLLRGNIET